MKIMIELDGEQHFSQVLDWVPPKQSQKRDKYKMIQANLNGYTVIRLLRVDVWNDYNDWKSELIKVCKVYNTPTCVFISDNKTKYENHIIDLRFPSK